MIEVNACSLIPPRSMIAASCKSINMNFYLRPADAQGEKVKSERREWADKVRDAGSRYTCADARAMNLHRQMQEYFAVSGLVFVLFGYSIYIRRWNVPQYKNEKDERK